MHYGVWKTHCITRIGCWKPSIRIAGVANLAEIEIPFLLSVCLSGIADNYLLTLPWEHFLKSAELIETGAAPRMNTKRCK